MINFYLPNFSQLNYKIVTLLEDYPEYFYDDIKIGAVYGCFPA